MSVHEHHHHHDKPNIAQSDLDSSQAICSVTGDIVSKKDAKASGHVRDHEGQTYYFCCNTCVQLFDKNPDKYAANTQVSDDLILIAKEQLVDNVWAFRFKAHQTLTWTPGQFIRVEIPHEHPDEKGTKRWFTVSSIPHDGYLQITTRLTDSTFKQALSNLPNGGTIKLLDTPEGDFVWEESEAPLLFIAAGIGITPFYSMLKDRGHSGNQVKATLIYNGRDEKLPFKEEFVHASKRHPEFSVKYVIGERLNLEKVQALMPKLMQSHIYISGPEAMVELLGSDFIKAGMPSERLHQDFFPHYQEDNY